MRVIQHIRVLICFLTPTLAHANASAHPPDTLSKAPSFIVEDAYGHKFDVARQKNKVVFLNFWALTCAPCKAEMPGINALQIRYISDTNLLVLPIDVDHNFTASTRYMYDKGFHLNVYTPAGVVPRSLFQGELPTTLVIDRKGNIVLFQQGEDHYDTPAFFRRIDSLLKQ